MSTSNNPYFGKVILFIIASIASFGVMKKVLPERLFPEQVVASENILIDSMMINAMNDTTSIVADIKDTTSIDSTQIQDITIDSSLDPAIEGDGYRNMERFYAKLHKLETEKSGTVRIGYFGDSMNDGDFIVQDIRSLFQESYGGRGVGYVAISSLSAQSRASVSHQYSDGWTAQSFVKVRKPTYPFGIDGQVFFAKDPAQPHWVRYRAQSQKYSTELNSPKLFYGRSSNDSAYITIKADGGEPYDKAIPAGNLLNTLTLASGNVKSLQVDFHNMDSVPVYGFDFDNGQGVHVDNFSMRGNSGLPLSILNSSLMNAFDRVLQYDLIILQYGANVLSQDVKSYGWYEKGMSTVVANLRSSFPNADILILSTADKASKIDQEMKTDPATTALVRAQRSYARKTGCGFISLYSLMGGEGSMVKWVDEYKMANKDYTHFNASGSRKIAKLIYGEIGKGYAKYKTGQE